jgi:excisionase family DNA binding protein
VAKESIYRRLNSKGFPAYRVGRKLRFKLSEMDEWITASSGDDFGSSRPVKPKETRSPGRKSSRKKKNEHG